MFQRRFLCNLFDLGLPNEIFIGAVGKTSKKNVLIHIALQLDKIEPNLVVYREYKGKQDSDHFFIFEIQLGGLPKLILTHYRPVIIKATA